jgi:MoaA/NifB/PqqE/SkfB family radical SAM enzyme
MLTGIHFLLTYRCIFECDHCFLYCGPHAKGTFKLGQLRTTLDEARKIGTIEWIYYEGGEPFLYYPLMVEGLRLAGGLGFKTGVVTNAYWANSGEDADLWLRGCSEVNVNSLSLSDDEFHSAVKDESPAKIALASAKKLKLPASTICIEEPCITNDAGGKEDKGEPIVGGDVVFRGRAIEKLADGLPRKPWESFMECTREELRNPGRVHVDSFGHVHICQGLSMGNMWKTPLSEIVKAYNPEAHPICGPLLRGGPAQLAREYNVEHDDAYIDECHLCFMLRRALVDRFPEHLAPRQVYGLEQEET